MQRVAIVIGSLRPGGTERFGTWLAGELSRRGREVRLVTLADDVEDVVPVPSGVRLDRFTGGRSQNHVLDALLRPARLLRLRALLLARRHEVVVSLGDYNNLSVLTALAGSGRRVIVAERTNPESYWLGRARERMRRLLYRRAFRVVVQTEHVARWARRFLPAGRVRVIPNGVQRPRRSGRPTSRVKGEPPYRVVSVGRLTWEKGHDRLLDAFAMIPPVQRQGWTLWIVGDGPERAPLEARIAALGLHGVVHLVGFQEHVADWLATADIFALPSRVEGFPNALLEAMAAGCACVAFDLPSGPRDLIETGRNGLLVDRDNVAEFAEALAAVMADPEYRSSLGKAAQQVNDDFSAERIVDEWLRTLDEAP